MTADLEPQRSLTDGCCRHASRKTSDEVDRLAAEPAQVECVENAAHAHDVAQ